MPMKPRFDFSDLFRTSRGIACGALVAAVLFSPLAQAQDRLVGQDYQKVAQLISQNHLDVALQAADSYLAGNPRDPQMRLLKSRILQEQGHAQEAQAVLLALTQEFPEIPEPHNNLAVLYARNGQLDLARTSLETALRNNPQYVTALENLGDVYRRMALDSYRKALTRQPGNKTLAAKISALQR